MMLPAALLDAPRVEVPISLLPPDAFRMFAQHFRAPPYIPRKPRHFKPEPVYHAMHSGNIFRIKTHNPFELDGPNLPSFFGYVFQSGTGPAIRKLIANCFAG